MNVGDVFVTQAYRGQGLGVWLMACVIQCAALAEIRMAVLATRAAHARYRKVGFELLPNPDRWMIIYSPDAWRRPEMIIDDL